MICASTSARSTSRTGRACIHRGPLRTGRPDRPCGSSRSRDGRPSGARIRCSATRPREPSITCVPCWTRVSGRTRGTLAASAALQPSRASVPGRTCIRGHTDRAGVTSHASRACLPRGTRETGVTRATTDTGGASSARGTNHALGLRYPPYVDNRHGTTLLASSSHQNTPAPRRNYPPRTLPQTYSYSRLTHKQSHQPPMTQG